MARMKLIWQSKLVLLAVLPFAAADVILETHWWAVNYAAVAVWTTGLSVLLGLVTWKLRAATPAAAATGAAITASLMFSTVSLPYEPWQSALVPVLAVSLLAFAATRLGRQQKERMGIAENRFGRSSSQVAANLGVAALVSNGAMRSWAINSSWFAHGSLAPESFFAVGLAAMAEAAADTVSSEIGQAFGGRPRLVTTLRAVDPGKDGAVTLAGTFSGMLAAGIVAGVGTLALRGGHAMFSVSCAGGVFGLFFDSLLGATLEERGWLNNDAVNFLSTASAALFAMGALAILH